MVDPIQQGPNPAKPHVDYNAVVPDWQLCRDLFAGERAMKKGERRKNYLIPLSGHKESIPGGPDAYEAYVERAYFFGAFGRTVEALTGLVTRVDPNIEAPAGLNDFLDDVDGQNTSAVEFCAQIVEELVKVGRVGVLTDWPTYDEKQRVKAEDQQDFRRPFVTIYHAENILNWRVKRCGAKTVLSMVVVQESETAPGEDEFSNVVVQQIRVFDLFNGAYRIRTFQLKTGEDTKTARWEQVGSDIFPTIDAGGGARKTLDEIQFDIINHWGCGHQVQRPPMTDLAFTAVAHFRNSADYENALHLMGFPQSYMNNFDLSQESNLDPTSPPGAQPKETVYHIGDGTMWRFRGPVEVKVVQFTQELDGLCKAIDAKRSDMVALGARMLAQEKKAAETARVEEIRRQPENSALGKIAGAGSKGITRIFQRAANWLKVTGTIKVELNDNFFDHELAPADLLAFIQAVQEGAFALSDLRWLMRRGNLIRAGRTDEEIDAELEQMGMPMSAKTAPPTAVDPATGEPIVPGAAPPPVAAATPVTTPIPKATMDPLG